MHKSVTIINSFPRTILYVVLAVLLVVTSISLWSSHKAAKAERHIRYVGILNKSDWYVRAKKSNDSFWSDPYYYYDGTNISGHYATFVKPVFDKSGRLACVCGADMTFEWLSKELGRIDKEIKQDALLNMYKIDDAEFYTVIINDDGSSIAYPEGKKVSLTSELTLKDLSEKKSGVVDMVVNGVPSTVYYGPVEYVDWFAAIVVT